MDDSSLEYAKTNKKDFLERVIANNEIVSDKLAVLMAGSPGAGKTEVATALADLTENICIIDADLFRVQFPDYNGSNSSSFQKGASWLVDHVFTFLLKKGYSFILDGTFAINRATQNVERALKRDYSVIVYYVYQDPYIAWDFTKKREQVEGRHVPKERFINAYFKSKENVAKIKEHFGESIEIIVIIKDYQNKISDILENIDNLDLVLPKQHSREELEENLNG